MQTAYASAITRAFMTCPYQAKIIPPMSFIADYWEIVYFRQSRTKLLRHITKSAQNETSTAPLSPLSMLITSFCVRNVRYESTLIKNNQHWCGGGGMSIETTLNLGLYIFS